MARWTQKFANVEDSVILHENYGHCLLFVRTRSSNFIYPTIIAYIYSRVNEIKDLCTTDCTFAKKSWKRFFSHSSNVLECFHCFQRTANILLRQNVGSFKILSQSKCQFLRLRLGISKQLSLLYELLFNFALRWWISSLIIRFIRQLFAKNV